MCGLFGGMSYYLAGYEIEKIEMLGIVSMFRGVHSTGMATVDKAEGKKKKGNSEYYYELFHNLGNSVQFFSCKSVREELDSKLQKVCILGHTRFATAGHKDDIAGAHPHKAGHIIGTHNGTIPKFNNHYEYKDRGTDSKILFEEIAEKGAKKALGSIMFGSYAVAFIDTKTKMLNFARNNERPLWLMTNKDKNTLYWASERIFLDFVRLRDNTTDHNEPFELETETLLSVRLGNCKQWKKEKIEPVRDFPPIVHRGRQFEDNEYKPAWSILQDHRKEAETDRVARQIRQANREVFGGYTEGLFRSWARDAKEKREEAQQKLLPVAEHLKNTPVTEADWLYQGWADELLELPEATKLLADGCATCGDPHTVNDKVYWIAKDAYHCDRCTQQDPVLRLITTGPNKRACEGLLIHFGSPNDADGEVHCC